MGAYSRWELIRGWAPIKLSRFSALVIFYFATKHDDVSKQIFNCSFSSHDPQGSLVVKLSLLQSHCQ